MNRKSARSMTQQTGTMAPAFPDDSGTTATIDSIKPTENLSELGQRVREIRKSRGDSLAALSLVSGVSKSMISKIERGEVTPSTTILAKVAEALGVTFSELMAKEQDSEIIHLPLEKQPLLSDPASGHVRRCLSPILPARGVDWVLNILPPGASTGAFPAHQRGVEEYIHVIQGRLKAFLGDTVHELNEGDAVYFQANVRHEFVNFGIGSCQYYLIINSQKVR